MREWNFSAGPRGLVLRVCEWQGNGLPVLILHGFLEQGAAWANVATRLGRQVVAPDQRGHGRSGHVGSGGFYHFWDYVGDVDALVAHLGGVVDLVGHSMGGTVASLFAGTRPECVRRLVLVEGLGPPDVSSQAVARARQFLAGLRRPSAHRPMPDVAFGVERIHAYNPTIPPTVAADLVARTTRATPDGLVWTWDALHRCRSPSAFSAEVFRTFLAEIRAPTLLLTGGASPFDLPDAEARAAAIADAREIVVPNAGHLLHHDAPEAVAQAIRAHLDAP